MRAAAVAAVLFAGGAHAAPAARSAYTSLRGCPVVTQNRAEGGYVLRRCGGVGGYALDVVEGDGRQAIAIRRAATRRQPNLAAIGGGGFSEIGPRAEWRVRAGRITPSALVVRYDVVERPEASARPTSYLVAIDLARGCVLGVVPPGAAQNLRARRIADAQGRCLGR